MLNCDVCYEEADTNTVTQCDCCGNDVCEKCKSKMVYCEVCQENQCTQCLYNGKCIDCQI